MNPQISRFFLQTAACALAVLLTGCDDPEEVILWAPDGRHAVLHAKDGDCLIDANGAILMNAPAQPGEEATYSLGTAIAWMPDSRRVLTVAVRKPQDWNEFATLLGAEREQSAVDAAEEMLRFIEAYHGDWTKFGSEMPRLRRWEERLDFAANYTVGSGRFIEPVDPKSVPRFYLHEKHPREFAAASTAPLFSSGLPFPLIFELTLHDALPGAASADRILVRSPDEIIWARSSPDGASIAFVCKEPRRPALYVIAANGGKPVRVDEGASDADWTPDGQWLAYQKTTAPYSMVEKQAQLGTLSHRKVCDSAGHILPALDEAEDLAGVLFSDEQNRVACLPDGRILFASVEARLPALGKDAPSELTLFAVRPGAAPAIERMVSDQAQRELPNRVDRFVLSPNGRYVAIPGSNGEVAVLSLQTGELVEKHGRVVDYKHRENHADVAHCTAPAWRNADELCRVTAPGSSGATPRRAELVLHRIGATPRVLSSRWSDSITDDFLPRPAGDDKVTR